MRKYKRISQGCESWYEFEDRCFACANGHLYYRGEKIEQKKGRTISKGKYLRITCRGNIPYYETLMFYPRNSWYSFRRTKKMPFILEAEHTADYRDSQNRECMEWIVRWPGDDSENVEDIISLVNCKQKYDPKAAELFSYAVWKSEEDNIEPVNILLNTRTYTTVLDVFPNQEDYPETSIRECLLRYLRKSCSYFGSVRQLPNQELFRRIQSANRNCPDIQTENTHEEADGAEIQIVFSDSDYNKATRMRKALTRKNPDVYLSDLSTDTDCCDYSVLSMYVVNGILYFRKFCESEWESSRISNSCTKGWEDTVPWPGEILRFRLDKNTEVEITVLKFLTCKKVTEKRLYNVFPRKWLKQAENNVASYTDDSGAAACQGLGNLSFIKQKTLSDLYIIPGEKIPEPGKVLSIYDRKKEKNVCMMILEDRKENEILIREIRYLLNHPIPESLPVGKLQDLLEWHEKDGTKIWVVIMESVAGWKSCEAGDPFIQALPMQKRYRIGWGLMHILDQLEQNGRIPAFFYEDRIRIDPDTLEVYFEDGAYLVNPGKVPFMCTLGYAAPECYSENGTTDSEVVRYAAAVWVYRLLTGGYPLEGRATLARIQSGDQPEREISGELYGQNGYFAFNPYETINSLDGLEGRYDRIREQYAQVDKEIRNGWSNTFVEYLTESRQERWTFSKWADVLYCLQKSSS